jgi:hypothetical protein
MNKRTKSQVTRKEMMDGLKANGYYVVKGAVTKSKCQEIEGLFFDYMEGMCPGFKRNDKTTWTGKNRPLHTKGLIQQYNASWQRYHMEAKMAQLPTFQELWDEDDLWSSFDGVSFTKMRYGDCENLADWEENCWEADALHIDQTTPGFSSVQGGLAVLDQPKKGHVFLCIPGSHLYHEELLAIFAKQIARANKKLAKEGKNPSKKLEKHWGILTKSHLAFLKWKGLKPERVASEAGDITLWDSRCVHSSAKYCKDAPKDLVRLQVFACMLPSPKDPKVRAREVKKRQNAYEKGLVSKHSADEVRTFGKTPRLRSTEQIEWYKTFRVPASCELSDVEKRLMGVK